VALTPEQAAYLAEHRWALLATTRADGTPQVSMLAYHWDGTDIVFSLRATAAKWANVGRQPGVVVTVADDARYLSVHGVAERVVDDPARHDLTVRLRDSLQPVHYASLQADIDAGLDARKRVVIRVVPSGAVGRI
jgi:PPOX class probable F420-dependent enzyme